MKPSMTTFKVTCVTSQSNLDLAQWGYYKQQQCPYIRENEGRKRVKVRETLRKVKPRGRRKDAERTQAFEVVEL